MPRLELKIPPALLLILLLALMVLLAWLTPWAVLPIAVRTVPAMVLTALGIAVAIAGVVAFHQARTTVDPMHPERASHLVTSGVYRFSRNPMYLGFLLVLIGVGIHLSNALAVLPVIAFVPYMNRFQIVPEEHWMREHFGEAYDAYCEHVRRWL